MFVRVSKQFSRQFLVACFSKDIAAPRVFVEVSENGLVKFSKENENENAVKKTECNLLTSREYLAAVNEQREIETLTFSASKYSNEVHLAFQERKLIIEFAHIIKKHYTLN